MGMETNQLTIESHDPGVERRLRRGRSQLERLQEELETLPRSVTDRAYQIEHEVWAEYHARCGRQHRIAKAPITFEQAAAQAIAEYQETNR